MQPATKVALWTGGGILGALLVAGILALSLQPGSRSRIYERMSSEKLHVLHEEYESAFDYYRKQEQECRQQGRLSEAEERREDARICLENMGLIRAELERRGKW